MRSNYIDSSPETPAQSGMAAMFDDLTSARLSTVVRESNGLIVVTIDGEGSGAPVA